MINRDDDPRRPAASRPPAREPMQPDPVLQAGRSSLRGWLVILASVVVLCLVLYGLNRPAKEQASGNAPAVTASPAPAAGVPAPPPQTTTGQAPDQAPASASPRPAAGENKPGN